MKAIIDIKPDPNDPAKCDEDCPASHFDKIRIYDVCPFRIYWGSDFPPFKDTRPQKCFDAEVKE